MCVKIYVEQFLGWIFIGMVYCKVQIIEITDSSFYPGICKAIFTDYYGKTHIIVDKPPIFGFEIENKKYEFPFEAVIRCEILDDMGNCIVIDTEHPDYIESQEELHVFKVNKKMIKSYGM